MSNMEDNTPRRSGRARKPKKFEGFEVKVEKIDYSYGDVSKPGNNVSVDDDSEVDGDSGSEFDTDDHDSSETDGGSSPRGHGPRSTPRGCGQASSPKGNGSGSSPRRHSGSKEQSNSEAKQKKTTDLEHDKKSGSKSLQKAKQKNEAKTSLNSKSEKKNDKSEPITKSKKITEEEVTVKDSEGTYKTPQKAKVVEAPTSDIRRSSRATKGQKPKAIDDDEYVTPKSSKSQKTSSQKIDESSDEEKDESSNDGEIESKQDKKVRKSRSVKPKGDVKSKGEKEESVSTEAKQKKRQRKQDTPQGKEGQDSEEENTKRRKKQKSSKTAKEKKEKDLKDSKSPQKKINEKTRKDKENEISQPITDAEETWSFVKSQFDTLSNILSEGGIENVILTSLAGEETFEFQGSEKGIGFLEKRIGPIQEHEASSQVGNVTQELEEISQSSFVWKIVEKQARNVVLLLSAVGVDTLMLTSVMTSQGVGCVGSSKGLEFLTNNPTLADIFPQYCNGTVPLEAEYAEKSFFGRWYTFITGKEIVEQRFIPTADVDVLQLREIKKEASSLYIDEELPELDFTAMEIQDAIPLCPVCNKIFKNIKILKKHYSLHTSKKKFTCDVCNKNFMRKYDCQQHMIRMHEYVPVEKGEVMRRDLAEAKNLFTVSASQILKSITTESDQTSNKEVDNNMEVTDGSTVTASAKEENGADDTTSEAQNQLNQPSEEAPSIEDLELLEGITPGQVDVTKISLEEIKKENIGDVDLSVTWETDQGRGDKVVELVDCDKLTCPICKKKLKNEVMLQRHLENHASDKNIACLEPTCKKKFKRKYDMEYHMVTVHSYVKLGPGNVVPKNQLPPDYKEKLRKLKRKKMRRGKGDKGVELSEDENEDPIDKLFGKVCPDCGATFKTNMVLKRHYVIHLGKKDFICEVCSKSFLRKYDMQIHQVNVHGYLKVKKGVVIKPDSGQDEIDELLLPPGMNTHTQGRKRTIHKCPYCDAVAFTRYNFDLHLEKFHSEENPFKCTHCELHFKTKRKMKMHWYFNHKEKRHKCQYCDKTFAFKYSLKDHEQSHIEEGGFLCGKCGKSFPLLKYLKKHERRHHGITAAENPDNKMYTCRYCSENIVGLGNFQQHMREHKSADERKYQCETCHKRFFTLGHLKRHEFVHKESRDYECEDCDKTYKDPDTLKKHQIAVHNKRFDSRMVYTCPEPECQGKGFLSLGHLRRHIYVHKGIKPFTCEECGRSFTEKATLVSHMRTHTGEKPYACAECYRTFSQQSHLTRHMMMHSEVKNFMCQICGRGFTGPDELKRHMIVHTDGKSHKCSMCPKTFHHLSSLKTHEKSHLESYECDICQQKFTQKSSMLIHRRRHTGERPFKCSECGKCFISKQLCKLHLRSHFPGQYTRHDCPQCKKVYSSRQRLRLHIMKDHPEESLESIPNFQEPIVLLVKSMKNGQVTEEVCKDEDSEYESYASEEEEMEMAEAELICPVCFLKFPDRDSVLKHATIHEDQSAFECKVCLEVYDSVESLHHHLQTRHDFIKLPNGDLVRKQMETQVQMDCDEGGVKTIYVQVESPTKYLNKPVKIAPKPSINLNQSTILRMPPTVPVSAGPSQSLIPTSTNTFRIAPASANVNQRRSFNIVEKDGTILHIVTPNDTKQDSVLDGSSGNTVTDDTTYLALPPNIVTEDNAGAIDQIVYNDPSEEESGIGISEVPTGEVQTIVVSAAKDEVPEGEFDPGSSQDESAIKSIINYQMEDAMQYVQEEVIETQVVPEAQTDIPDEEIESAISQIAFDQGGGITELSAANLAALYGSDKIIYQEERSDGTEVVHVYAVVQKDNPE